MTTDCSTCHGEGLVGTGDQPWLKLGDVRTCAECAGTGKVSDGAFPVSTPEVVPEEVLVDNSNSLEDVVNPESVPVEVPLA